MEPFYSEANPNRLFSIYHPPTHTYTRATGVILCYPMGNEYIRAHRAFLHLANNLSKQGFPTLRFDYFGCGDSNGHDEDGTIEQWCQDIQNAISILTLGTDIHHIALVGLRLGAALSLKATENQEIISSVVLWDPVVDGKHYLHELAETQRSWLQQSFSQGSLPQADIDINEVMGFPLTPTIKQELQDLNLLRLSKKPIGRLNIITCTQTVLYDSLHKHLQNLGSEVESRIISEPRAWIKNKTQQDTHLVPRRTTEAIVSWLSEVNL